MTAPPLVGCVIWTNSARLIVADVKQPLLGEDFLRQYKLLVDVCGQRMIETDMYVSVSCDVTVTSVSQLAPIEIGRNKYRKVLNDVPELLQPTFSHSTVSHGVQHDITTTGSHVHARARRLSPDKLTIAKNEWKAWASFKSQTFLCHPPCTLSLNHKTDGDHVEIIVD